MASTKLTFDPANKLIVCIEVPALVDGVTLVEQDIKEDFYSDAKEDWLADDSLNKFRFPMESVGGDATTGSKSLGATFFLKAGWKIRPYEGSHTYRLNGNLYTRDGSSVFTSTVGVYQILTEMVVSSLVDSTVQQLAEIEFASFANGVTLDPENTTGNAKMGVTYPAGTMRQPCLDISEGISILAKGFSTLYLLGSGVFTSAHDIDRLLVLGISHVQNVITLEEGASCYNSIFRELEIFGTLDGNNHLENCVVNELTYFSGHIHMSGLKSVITLAGGGASLISDCKTVDPFSPPSIDMGESGQDLAMPNYSGLLTIINFNGPSNFAGIGLTGGTVILDSTSVVAGTIQCAGVGSLVDENGVPISSGTWNGGVNIINQTVTEETVVEKVWAYKRTP